MGGAAGAGVPTGGALEGGERVGALDGPAGDAAPAPRERTEGRGDEGPRLGQVDAAFESVAAHQADCLCHPKFNAVGPGERCCGRDADQTDARDKAGQPWHVDPLCKIRPEARA